MSRFELLQTVSRAEAATRVPENAVYIGSLNNKLYQLLFLVMGQSSVFFDRQVLHCLATQSRQKGYIEREISRHLVVEQS